jgi:hypothetical protein
LYRVPCKNERKEALMAKKAEDHYEQEVRRRYADMLAAAGIDAGRLSLEVLYLLPPEFVRMYTELFDKALSVSPTSAGPMGKDEGRVKKAVRREGVGARESQIKGTKKAHKKHWVVRSEPAMEAKRRLDRSLVRSVERALEQARRRDKVVIGAATKSGPAVPDDTQVVLPTADRGENKAQQGLRTEQSTVVNNGDSRSKEPDRMQTPVNQCPVCGQFQSPRWTRCPFHEE